MLPYLTLNGFIRRSSLDYDDILIVERKQQGFTQERLYIEQEVLESRLRKRYAIPFGRTMGPPTGIGTAPPTVIYGNPPEFGSPISGDIQMILNNFTPGPTGTATFMWSPDGGITWNGPLLTAPQVILLGTGLTVLFPPTGTFSVDNQYLSSTSCPRQALSWLAILATPAVYARRGVNPTNDQQMVQMMDARKIALEEIKEAADGKEGLYELPLNEDAATSAVTAPQPLFCTQSSPFVWMDFQRARGRAEDNFGQGFGGPGFPGKGPYVT